MLKEITGKIQPERWMVIFLWIHILVWTLVPYWVRYALPLDAMEGATWGHQLEWGYDKNPFVNGWLTALAVYLDQYQDWAVYLFSQLSVAICFLAVWQLAKKMVPPIYALLAVFLLEGIQYYNVHSIDFNDNTIELSLWALTALWFYNALKSQSVRDWMLVGLLAGLGMMTKYYTIVLLIPMFLFLLVSPTNRQTFIKPAFYLGMAVFVAVVLPHVIWLFSHDFITVNYAFKRVHSRPTWINHLEYSGRFAWQQVEAFLPAVAMALLFFVGDEPRDHSTRIPVNRFDRLFLLFVGVGPFLLTILLSAFTGMKLRAGWGTPLLSLWGILLMVWLHPPVTVKRFYRFIVLFFVLIASIVVGYSAALVRADEPSSANFPGKVIASVLTQEWRNTYHSAVPYIAGSRWVAGNVAYYSADHPPVYIDWNPRISPWIDEAKLQAKGAIFVWDTTEPREIPSAETLARFKKLGDIKIMRFSWLRNKQSTPVEIAVAFLPPM